MVITAIEPQKRHRNRLNIFVDGEFAFGIDRNVLLKHGLRKGDAIDPEIFRKVAEDEELSRARTRAMRLLSYRLRTELELQTRLREDEFPPSVIEKVLTELRTSGYLDDSAFARAYLHDVRMRKPAGKRFLSVQLRRKGVPKDLTTQVLEEQYSEADELESAVALATKTIRRFRSSVRPLSPEQQSRRLTNALSRRGFSWPTIRSVLKKFFTNVHTLREE
ncbi:MAG TPA: RecX family transcriptional regulator [Bacteroidota bacterium]|nr:RecX family transcriptional regulator [Bacteroidota bacterium]